jgi:hypothetical protein
MKHLRKIATKTPLRTMTNMEPRRVFTWLPKKMNSGSIVWFGYYWVEEYLASVEPRHLWINTTTYTEREYFLKKLQGEING